MQATKLKSQKRHSVASHHKIGVRAAQLKVEFDELNEYTDPVKTRQSLERALKDVRRGRLHAKL